MKDWKKTTLGEVVEYETEKTSEIDINTYISTENMLPNKGGVVIASSLPAKGNFIKYSEGQTLVSNIRPYFKKVWKADKDGACSNDVLCFKLEEDINDTYFYYLLNQDSFFEYVMKGAKGTKMPRGDRKHILAFVFNLPPLDEQKRIAHVLSALDDKIEVNNKINDNLEKQAQAIFKQWFVDFEFPDAEGKPYKSNGGKFIDSELGEIPEGWRLGSIGDYCKVRSGFAFKSSWWLDDNFKEDKVKVIKIKCIDNSQINLNDCSFVSSDKCELAREFLVNEGDLVIAMTGATLGKFAIIPKLDEKLLVNQRVGKFFLGVKPIEKMPFLHLTLKQDRVYNEIVNKGQGSAQPNISSSDIENVEIVFPNEEILCDFNSKMNYLYQLLSNNKNENQKLSELRDSLLPRLMSGEVRV